MSKITSERGSNGNQDSGPLPGGSADEEPNPTDHTPVSFAGVFGGFPATRPNNISLANSGPLTTYPDCPATCDCRPTKYADAIP